MLLMLTSTLTNYVRHIKVRGTYFRTLIKVKYHPTRYDYKYISVSWVNEEATLTNEYSNLKSAIFLKTGRSLGFIVSSELKAAKIGVKTFLYREWHCWRYEFIKLPEFDIHVDKNPRKC